MPMEEEIGIMKEGPPEQGKAIVMKIAGIRFEDKTREIFTAITNSQYPVLVGCRLIISWRSEIY